VPSFDSIRSLIANFKANSLYTILTISVLGAGVLLGSFLASLGKQLGTRGAEMTANFIRSHTITRLASSRISDLTYSVAILNTSSLPDADVRQATEALQEQVTRDFAPIWGTSATLKFVPKGSAPPKDAWRLEIVDVSDQSEMMTYHTVTTEGLPYAQISVSAARTSNLSWTALVSHELLSLLVNPRANLTVFVPKGPRNAGTIYSYEVAAPCEGFTYEVGGTPVSDFVTPAWFEDEISIDGARFDYLGKIAKPFQVLPGGHASVFEVKVGGRWRFDSKPT